MFIRDSHFRMDHKIRTTFKLVLKNLILKYIHWRVWASQTNLLTEELLNDSVKTSLDKNQRP